MRPLVIAFLLAACEEHGSSPCPGGVCPDGGTNPTTDGGGVPGCADDSAIEPNDSIQTATTVPIGGGPFTIAGVAICPDGDRDHFAVDIPMPNNSLSAIASFDGAPLLLSILNAGGTSIANGTIGGTDAQVCVPNLPAGRFFVQTSGVGVVSNYRLSIEVAATCP